MNKAKFIYRKADGSEKERELIRPAFVKESYNKFHNLDSDKVNYIQGYELDKNVPDEERKLYEEAIKDYYELAIPTIEEFLTENNLDPKKIKYKTFKKDGINELEVF